jgi:hypothetical protein
MTVLLMVMAAVAISLLLRTTRERLVRMTSCAYAAARRRPIRPLVLVAIGLTTVVVSVASAADGTPAGSAPAPAVTINSIPARSDCTADPKDGPVEARMTMTANITVSGAAGQLYAVGVYVPGTPWPFITTVTPDTEPWTANLTFTSALPNAIIASAYGGRVTATLYRDADVQKPIDSDNTTLAACPGFAWPTASCSGSQWKLVHPGNDQVFRVSIGYAGEGGTVTLLKAGATSSDPEARLGELAVPGHEATLVKDDFGSSRLVTKYECAEPEPTPTPTPTATATATATPTPDVTPDPTPAPDTTPNMTVVPSATAGPTQGATPSPKVALLARSAKPDKKGRVALKLFCTGASQCSAKARLTYKANGKTIVVATKSLVLKSGNTTVTLALSKAALRKLKKAKVKSIQVALA